MKIFPSLSGAPIRLAAAVLGLFSSGCGLSLGEVGSSNLERNSCSDNDECGGGTTCSSGICQEKGRETELPSFLLSTTLPSGSGSLSGLSFYQVIDKVRGDVELSRPSILQASVVGSPIEPENCLSYPITSDLPESDELIPFRVTFAPRTRLLGLPNPPIIRQTNETMPRGRELDIIIPAGNYDVYVEPTLTDEGCLRPPVLYVDKSFPSGSLPLTIELPPPQVLEVKVSYPQDDDDLGDYQLSLIERNSGRLLSNSVELGTPEKVDEGLEYSVKLAFTPIETEVGELASEIVRLAPPEGRTAPTLYIERSIIGLFQGGKGVIDQLSALPQAVTYGTRVAIVGQATGTPARVSFVATKLATILPGTVASLSKTVETKPSGEFDLELLPGNYRVLVQPKDEALASLETEIVVSDVDSVQRGPTLEVSSRRAITGRLKDFAGKVISGVSISAQPTPVPPGSNVLTFAQGEQVFASGSVNTVSGDDGRFALRADAGEFSLLARPQSSSGYAWYVKLSTEVEKVDVNLRDIRLPPPALWEGTIRSAGSDSFPNAVLRVYGFVNAGQLVGREAGEPLDVNQPPALAESVIQVAETRADENGRYRLLLPSSLK